MRITIDTQKLSGVQVSLTAEEVTAQLRCLMHAEELRVKDGCVCWGVHFYQTESPMSKPSVPSKRLRNGCINSILSADISAVQYTNADGPAFLQAHPFLRLDNQFIIRMLSSCAIGYGTLQSACLHC